MAAPYIMYHRPSIAAGGRRVWATACMLLLCTGILSAQELSVTRFYLDGRDQTANTSVTQELDQNGEVCALVKVETTLQGLNFEAGTIGVWKTVQKEGEVWVYLPAKARRLTIHHKDYLTLRNYEFPTPLQSARTYIMRLSAGGKTDDNLANRMPSTRQQFVVFKVQPHNALVHFDGTVFEPDANGVVEKFVRFGSYDYRVEAPHHHAEVGKVVVDNAKHKVEKTIKLRPAYGTLKVGSTTANGGNVYVDGERQGMAPLTTEGIPSGQHTLRIIKPLYKPYESTFTVFDGQTTDLSPLLVTNSTRVTFTVGNNAEIWINGVLRGRGRVVDNLEAGTYLVECKLNGHRPSSASKHIPAGSPDITVPLEAPTPLYGSLLVTSKPSGADLYIDGKRVGTTPYFSAQFLVGTHIVAVLLPGYDTVRTSVNIAAGQQSEIPLTFNRTPQNQ